MGFKDAIKKAWSTTKRITSEVYYSVGSFVAGILWAFNLNKVDSKWKAIEVSASVNKYTWPIMSVIAVVSSPFVFTVALTRNLIIGLKEKDSILMQHKNLAGDAAVLPQASLGLQTSTLISTSSASNKTCVLSLCKLTSSCNPRRVKCEM